MNRTSFSFGILGGDRRFSELARLLEQDGYAVRTWRTAGQGVEQTLADTDAALEPVLRADAVILPLPVCGPDGTFNGAGKPLPLPELLDRMARAGVRHAFAGMVSADVRAAAEARGVELADYFRRESLTIANAAATADAAVCLAAEHRAETLCGKRCLVLGFGRIGKLLCARLRGLGASVTAAARREEDRAWARSYGYGALDTGDLSGKLGGFDAVFNTVPAPVLSRALLRELPPDCLLMELASSPGFDPSEAEGLDVVPARSLPGRMVPRTAAAILRDTILLMLKERDHA